MLGRRTKRTNGKASRPHGRKSALIALAVFLFAGALLAAPHASRAVDVGLNFATATGLSTVDIRVFVGRVIRYFLGLLGIIAVSLIIYAGYLYMTSAGEAEKIDKAKKIMVNAVIGLVIIMSAYAIVSFLFNALAGNLGPGGAGGGAAARFNSIFSGNRGTDALGNGIIEYHYPEPGQTDVPRNTKIAITFKKPLLLSTVLKHYDDNGTYTVTDDRQCVGDPPCPTDPLVSSLTNPSFQLNTANLKIIPVEGLGTAGSGTIDQQFDNRYPDSAALVNPAPTAKVTTIAEPLTLTQEQTLVIKPVDPIGSPSTNMNYRVALRGGDNGVKVWTLPSGGGDPVTANGFSRTYADGGYYWTFTTNTTIDTTPPQIVALVPVTTTLPGTPPASILDRNQLLQVYFTEAVDPTTASGVIGTGGGFSNVEVKAACLPGTYPTQCVFNSGNLGTVDGTLVLGNRYRTAEFTPSSACEGVAENSCGEQVFCLPKNVSLTVRTLAATIAPGNPAAVADNGVEDMAGNSLDGNNNGTAEGPQPPAQPTGRALDYYRNDPPADLSAVSDSTRWVYQVGSNVDLTVPTVTALDPASSPPDTIYQYGTCTGGTKNGQNCAINAECPGGTCSVSAGGPSKIPVDLSPAVAFSKTMSIGSLRSGGFDEVGGTYTSPVSTLVLRSKECLKTIDGACPMPPSACPCTPVDPPGFMIDAGLPVESPNGSGNYISVIRFMHPTRPFYNANDLGYTDSDVQNHATNVPMFGPIVRAQIRDTKQNCFWPSQYKPVPASALCTLANGQYSCCEQNGSTDSAFLANCKP